MDGMKIKITSVFGVPMIFFGASAESLSQKSDVTKDKKASTQTPNYTIQKNDKIENLAAGFNMNVKEFKKFAGLSSDKLPVNKEINVPTIECSTNLSSIARKYNMSLKDLLKLNPQIKDSNKIKKNEIINVPIKPFGKAENSNPTPTPSPNADKNEKNESSPSAKVRLGNGKTVSSATLQKEMNEKRLSDVPRPAPVLDSTGRIVADVKEYLPTGSGPLKGKTIIVNAGHGGYNPKNGSFDIGTHAKDAKGKNIEEWYKNQNFTKEIIPALQAKGAKVIYMSGSAKSVMDAKAKYKKADLFVSIHCDSSTNKNISGQTIIYNQANPRNKKFAQTIDKNLDKQKNVKPELSNIKSDDRGLGVLKGTAQIPSIIVETGFQSNAKDLANIDWPVFRKDFAQKLTSGITEYLTDKK